MRMSLTSLMALLALALAFLGPCPGFTAPLEESDEDPFDLENYDLNTVTDWGTMQPNIYGDNYDYEDLDQEVSE